MSDLIDASGGGPQDIDVAKLRGANVAAIDALEEGGRVEYWVFRFPDGVGSVLVVGRDHDPLVYQAVQGLDIEGSGFVELHGGRAHASDASIWARDFFDDMKDALRHGEVLYTSPTRTDEPSGGDHIDASGGGPQAIDPTTFRQTNIKAIDALSEGGRVEYWVFKEPDGTMRGLVVGRDHDPLVYQSVQAWEVESSGYVEVANLRAHAAEADFWARDLLEDLQGETRFREIHFWAPEQVVIDFAGIKARNQANVKATPDGGRVPFRTVATPTGVIVLIGDGHPDADAFGMDARESGEGEIQVKKGRLFNAGKLNVIGAAPDEQFDIHLALNEFSDKEVVFDEGEDEDEEEA